jgi:glyoxylase-like metal-dependent hydrolase (beta-lactamase superfamily II)
MLHLHEAEGVHRIEDSFVNWFLIEDGGRLTAVDAGLPASWDSLNEAVQALGRSLGDLEAVVLTHAHVDHVGFAERARSELGVPVLVHAADVTLTRHPLRYDFERLPVLYLWRPGTVRIMVSLLRSGAVWAKRIEKVGTFADGAVLDVPGRPRVVHTPGHTYGHCALHLPDRDVLIAGDAVVTRNPYTAGTGPQLVARAATADSAQAVGSLDRLGATGAGVVMVGHGETWRGGAADMARRAKAHGLT